VHGEQGPNMEGKRSGFLVAWSGHANALQSTLMDLDGGEIAPRPAEKTQDYVPTVNRSRKRRENLYHILGGELQGLRKKGKMNKAGSSSY